MTRWFLLWTLVLLAVALYGAEVQCTWMMLLPLPLLPIIWADQYVTAHYSEEESS